MKPKETTAFPVPQEELLRDVLREGYQAALKLNDAADESVIEETLGADLADKVKKLAVTKHAARGAALTLALYKAVEPRQDVRRHKSGILGGFSARGVDARVTVPFLREQSLQYNVETHWLSQSLSFVDVYDRNAQIATTPKHAGPLFLDVINDLEDSPPDTVVAKARGIVQTILLELVRIRNTNKLLLTKPKNLTIETVLSIVDQHFRRKYKSSAPRLPQVAMHAMYQCLMKTTRRYAELTLRPLERMKSADRKSGTIGDVVVERDGTPVEAVEVKTTIPVNSDHVAEAIQKIQSASVERYLVLSTEGVSEENVADIAAMCESLRKKNGCELIVNGVLDTLKYYLRILKSVNDFVIAYAEALETDADLSYEHRIAWNEICEAET